MKKIREKKNHEKKLVKKFCGEITNYLFLISSHLSSGHLSPTPEKCITNFFVTFVFKNADLKTSN